MRYSSGSGSVGRFSSRFAGIGGSGWSSGYFAFTLNLTVPGAGAPPSRNALASPPSSPYLHELTTALAEEYRVTAETAGLSLRIDTSSHVPPIQTDASRVRQILGNLLSNAIKYTDKGSVTIRPYHVDAGPGGERRGYVKVDVIDTGPGIAADQQERLFREFSRINPGDKPGTGLGLAISQRLAHMLGGTITLQSEQGRGSTFSLWLPLDGPLLLRRAESAVG